jgi:hypothetical protein
VEGGTQGKNVCQSLISPSRSIDPEMFNKFPCELKTEPEAEYSQEIAFPFPGNIRKISETKKKTILSILNYL